MCRPHLGTTLGFFLKLLVTLDVKNEILFERALQCEQATIFKFKKLAKLAEILAVKVQAPLVDSKSSFPVFFQKFWNISKD